MRDLEKKLAGVGIVNLVVIWAFVVLMTVGAKVVLTKYPVKGLSEVVQAV